MCLIGVDLKIKIAEEDIICYKGFRSKEENILQSPYMNTHYKVNTLYSEAGLKIRKSSSELSDSWEDAFNSFSPYDTIDCRYVVATKVKNPNVQFDVIEEGFHSCNTFRRIEGIEKIIYACIIPKGAEYCEGPTGLLVSNQIIVKVFVSEYGQKVELSFE